MCVQHRAVSIILQQQAFGSVGAIWLKCFTSFPAMEAAEI